MDLGHSDSSSYGLTDAELREFYRIAALGINKGQELDFSRMDPDAIRSLIDYTKEEELPAVIAQIQSYSPDQQRRLLKNTASISEVRSLRQLLPAFSDLSQDEIIEILLNPDKGSNDPGFSRDAARRSREFLAENLDCFTDLDFSVANELISTGYLVEVLDSRGQFKDWSDNKLAETLLARGRLTNLAGSLSELHGLSHTIAKALIDEHRLETVLLSRGSFADLNDETILE